MASWMSEGAGGISSVSFVDDSPYLISGGSDGSLILWNWQQPLPGAPPIAYEAYRFLNSTSTTAHTGAITAIDFNPFTNTVASASEDITITLWPMNHLVEARESQTAE
jgi:centriolar protein POC1